MTDRKRLDVLLVERGLVPSREKAQALILAGAVFSGERRLDKAGQSLSSDTPLEVRGAEFPHVSRAGLKIEHALDHFHVSPEGRVCLDVGASTGGFTDCLLSRGASHVFAVDVGYGQLDQKLRNEPRVSNMERLNARNLTRSLLERANSLAGQISLVVVDVSFISLRTVLPALTALKLPVRDWLFLFKPQFEVGRKYVLKGGVVKDPASIQTALAELHSIALAQGLERRGEPENSPLAGKKSGNVELLLHYVPVT